MITIINVITVSLSAYDMTSKSIAEIIYTFTRFGVTLVLCIWAIIEFHIRHENPSLLPIISIKNKIFKIMHVFIFYIGFFFFCLKILLFCMFPYAIFSMFELPI